MECFCSNRALGGVLFLLFVCVRPLNLVSLLVKVPPKVRSKEEAALELHVCVFWVAKKAVLFF